jgi:hypothetical protein
LKKLLVIALLLFATSASAQNYLRDDGIFHSVVEGTTNGQCLTNSSGLLAGVACVTPGAPSGSVQYNNGAGGFAGNAGLTYSAGNALVISPTALTNNSALNITNSTPNGGSVAGPINLNIITTTDGTQTVTGSGDDSFGLIANTTSGFRSNLRVTGGSANHFAINGMVDVTATQGGAIGVGGGARVSSGNTVTGDIWGGDFFAKIGSGSTLNQTAFGISSEVGGSSTATLRDRIGISISTFGQLTVTGTDTALLVTLDPSETTPYNGSIAFANGIYFNSNFVGAGTFPIATTGNVLLGDTGTVTNFAQFPTLTITGNILNFPFAQLTGPGTMLLGFGSSAASNTIAITCSTCGEAQMGVAANGTGATDSIRINDVSGNNVFISGVAEASNNITRFGQTLGNWGQVITTGTTNVGLMIGTLTSEPLILGTNNTARITITGAGATTIAGGTTITGSFTATGLVTNADLANSATTVNGQTCTLGSTCSISVGTVTSIATASPITGGTITTTGTIACATCVTSAASLTSNALVIGAGSQASAVTTTGTGVLTALGNNANVSGGFVTSPVANVNLANSTISGVALGSNLFTLTFGTHLITGGSSYNGSAAVTITSDATNANTVSTIVARDGSGNFSAGTITAAVSGHASSDCALTGCTMSGAIAMGTNAITGLTTLAAASAMTFQYGGSTFGGSISSGGQWLLSATSNTVNANNGPLTVSRNTGAVSSNAAPLSTTVADLIGVDGAAARLSIQAFGNGGGAPSVIYHTANNTAASPTASTSGNLAGANFAFGYATTGAAGYVTGAGAGFTMTITETTCLTTACGENVAIVATPAGGASQETEAVFQNGVVIGASGTAPGQGSVLINAQAFMPNITTSSAAQTGTVCWTTGTGKFTADTTLGCLTSGARFKKNIRPIENAMTELRALTPSTYEWINPINQAQEGEQIGMVADDVWNLDHRLAGLGSDGLPRAWRQDAVLALTVRALQQAEARIAQLEQRK